MIKIENVVTPSPEQWEAIIMGTRNPMNSWDRSDTMIYEHELEDWPHERVKTFNGLGYNDHDLMMRLAKGGPVHAKYRRMIAVYVDITAPLYWWKEFDTYKVGTVANSCSTMHKIAVKEFTLEDFSHEHLFGPDDMLKYDERSDIAKDNALAAVNVDGNWCYFTPQGYVQMTCNILNHYREKYLETKDKKYWWQMIQLLPSSYNQRRTVMLNYEVLANIYKSRRNHKLDEWHTFCDWIEGLPYSELITGMTESEKVYRLGEKLQEGFAAGVQEAFADALKIDKSVLFGEKAETPKEEWPTTIEEASKAFNEMSQAVNKIRNSDIEDSVDISHLVDITCSWDIEELGGERIYAIGPDFTREDLTPYELYLLERTEEYERRKEGK